MVLAVPKTVWNRFPVIHIISENFWVRTQITCYRCASRFNISVFREQTLKYDSVILLVKCLFNVWSLGLKRNERKLLMHKAYSLECLNKKQPYVNKKIDRGVKNSPWEFELYMGKMFNSTTPELWGALVKFSPPSYLKFVLWKQRVTVYGILRGTLASWSPTSLLLQ